MFSYLFVMLFVPTMGLRINQENDPLLEDVDFLERNFCKSTNEKLSPASSKLQSLTIDMLDEAAIQTMTSDDFVNKFVKTRTPVLLRGASKLFLHNVSLWSWNGIRNSELAHLTTLVSPGSRGVSGNIKMKLEDFMDQIENGNRSLTSSFPLEWYDNIVESKDQTKKSGMLLEAEALRNVDTSYVSRLLDEHKSHRFGRFTFFMHNEGGNFPHHHEGTFNVLTAGAKRWTMFDGANGVEEKDAYRKFPYGTASKSWHWFEEDEPRLEVPHWDFIQESADGDVVYIPDNMIHATMDLCVPTIGMALGILDDHKDAMKLEEHI